MIRWSMSGGERLAACGLDAERVARFAKLVGLEQPWPMIFSRREAAHAAGLPRPEEAFCASFCCKEALLKALETTYPFPECELLYQPQREEQALTLSPDLRRRFGIAEVRVRFLAPREGELAAVVYLQRGSGG